METTMKRPPRSVQRRTYGEDADRALNLLVVLARCSASVGRMSARDIQRYGLTQAQFCVLEVLHHRGAMPLCMIGEKLLVTGGNVTYVADQLEKAGLLKRQRTSEDRRVIMARLTSRGAALMEKCFPEHAEYIAEAAELLTPREQADLARLLKKWGKAVQAR